MRYVIIHRWLTHLGAADIWCAPENWSNPDVRRIFEGLMYLDESYGKDEGEMDGGPHVDLLKVVRHLVRILSKNNQSIACV